MLNPDAPFIVHTCEECSQLRRERDRGPWRHELVLEGDRYADVMNWLRSNHKGQPWRIECERKRVVAWEGFSHPANINHEDTERTIIRSPDKAFLALMKLFLA